MARRDECRWIWDDWGDISLSVEFIFGFYRCSRIQMQNVNSATKKKTKSILNEKQNDKTQTPSCVCVNRRVGSNLQ